jgi:hypothetical protein
LCIGTVPKKHRPQEGETKWFRVERASESFQGEEEEVKGGEYKKTSSIAQHNKYPSNHCNHCNMMATPRKNVGNYIQS